MLPRPLERFFFRPVSSRGFSLMRIAWALFAGAFLLMQWKDVAYYYSDAGVLPDELEWIVARDAWRFTLLEWVERPSGVFSLYLILLVCTFCMMIGLWPRVMTIASVLLLFTFHERNPMVLGGGDTLLRNLGFLLMLAPGIGGFSLSRLQEQWRHWKQARAFLPPLTMPIWPWRLLLWQLVVLYVTSLWYKLLGTMWLDGTAVEATFHHPTFARFPPAIMNPLMPVAGIGDYFALLWQGAWVLLLIPENVRGKIPGVRRVALKRLLIVGGVFFHGGILLLMDAGVFSLVLFTAYLGLLLDEDFAWMKRVLNRRTPKPITVLFDGHCGLCLRSVFTLQLIDWLGRLRYVDFRDETARAKEAPDVTISSLDKAMHIRLPDGSYLTGFDAFRHISRRVPILWPLWPFLWIPGVAPIGRKIYAKIADSRQKCDHESCRL